MRSLGKQLGLQRLDGNLCADGDSMSSIQVTDHGRHSEYIPYTDSALNWHTDGYYNDPAQRIRAFLMHCICAAEEGGENQYIDHELVYIRVRDENPDFIRALMAPNAMSIPANIEQARVIRPAQSGPVFYIDADGGNLYMRYTARARNIIWKDDAYTLKAVAFLRELLVTENCSAIRYRLRPGEGVICNNVLHSRTAFKDGAHKQRLLYRARYYDRIAGTDVADWLQAG